MKKASDQLRAGENLYVACHILPDGDAVGSLLGLGLGLLQLGKACTLACADPIPGKFALIPGMPQVVAQQPTVQDTIVTVDSSDVLRLGSLYDESLFKSRPVVNIDHHVTNTGYGTVNLVLPLPSTAEIVLLVLDELGVHLDAAIATALLMGLITDTRGFRTANVGKEQLQTAIRLMEAGASITCVTEQVLNREPVSTICLWGRALARMQTRGPIIWTEIDQSIQRECGASPNEGGGLSSFLASAEGSGVAIVFREADDGRIDVSMRASSAVDISKVAVRLGGGGHPRAAGATIAGEMSAVRETVLAAVSAALAEQRGRAEAELGEKGDANHVSGPERNPHCR